MAANGEKPMTVDRLPPEGPTRAAMTWASRSFTAASASLHALPASATASWRSASAAASRPSRWGARWSTSLPRRLRERHTHGRRANACSLDDDQRAA
jgi:hypothetical protein